jgi:peptidoglycan-associated lipoprotein
MTTQWLRSLSTMALAALLAGGCAGGGSAPQPVVSAADPVQTDTTPVPALRSSAFDANGNPYVPGTQRALKRTVYFDYDRSTISADDLAVLEMHAMYLRDNPDRNVVVEGHCDERGTREYNLALGERRSDVVRKFLTSAGVSPRQIESVSYGEERSQVADRGESAWSKNRRAEMVYR